MKKLLFALGILIAYCSHAQTIQFLGTPTTQIYVRGQLRVDSIVYLPLRDTTFTPTQKGALVVKSSNGGLYLWNGLKWNTIPVGSTAWGTITGSIASQTDLMALLNGYQPTLTAGYGVRLVSNTLSWDSTNVRKVDTVYRTDDSTLTYAINGHTYSVLIRGTAAGGINSLIFNVPGALYTSPIIFSNAGAGAWSGTEVLNSQSSATFFAGPITGSPAQPGFRTMTISDLPTGIPNANLANTSIGLSLTNAGTSPSWTGSSVNLGGTAVLNIPYASSTTNGIISNTDWINFNTATSPPVTSVNSQLGAVVIGNADSIKKYPVDTTSHRQGYVLTFDSTNHKWVLAAGSGSSGTVTSVGMTVPSFLTVGGTPVTTAGTLAVSTVNQSANTVFAGPATGSSAAPGFRAIVNADLPTSGVSAGTYNSVTLNAQGIATAASNVGSGITSLNGLTGGTQTFATGTSGSDFNISSVGTAHTFNFPDGSGTNRGLITSADWTTFNTKQNAITLTTTGTSGAATLVGATLNIPAYSTAATVSTEKSITGDGTSGSKIKLVNDTTNPNKWNFYGASIIDSTRGFFPIEENSNGQFYNKSTWADATTGFVNIGSASVAVTSGKLVFTGGATDGSKALLINFPTMLDKWEVGGTFTIGTKNATATDGFAIGKYSINTTAPVSLFAKFKATSTSGGFLQIIGFNSTPGVQLAISTTALSFSIADSIGMTLERDGYTVTAKVRNITTNSAPIITQYFFSTYPPDGPATIDNTGDFCMVPYGGNFTVDSLFAGTKYPRNAMLMVGGDSKVQGYYVTNQMDRITDQVGLKIRSTLNGGGGSDKTIEMSACVPSIILVHPKQFFNLIGSNDIRAGEDSTTYCTRYDSINTALSGAGIDVFVGALYEASVSVLPLWHHIQQVYPASKIINVYDPMKIPGALYSDNIHPTSFGDSLVTNATLKAYKIYGQNERYASPPQNYIWNQSRIAQPAAAFNVSGPGKASSFTTATAYLGPITNETSHNASIGTTTTGQGVVSIGDTTAGTDAKFADMTTIGNHFYLRLLPDNGLSATNVLDVLRSGSTATSLTIPEPLTVSTVAGTSNLINLAAPTGASGINITGSVTGFTRPFASTVSATAGNQLFMQNNSTNSGAYTNVDLTTAGSGSGSPTIAFNIGGLNQYYLGENRTTGNFQLEAGQNFFSEWTATHLMIIKPTGQVGIGAPSSIPRMLSLKGTFNITKDSLPINAGGSVMTVGIDTASGDIVRFPSSNTIPPNVGAGYRIYAPQIPGFRSIVPGFGQKLDSTTNANSLTLVSDTAATANSLKKAFLPLFPEAAKTIFQNGNDITFAGGGRVNYDSLRLVASLFVNPGIAGASRVFYTGDSYTFGLVASPITKAYPYLFSGYLNKPAVDSGVSSAVFPDIAGMVLRNISYPNNAIVSTMGGLNNFRATDITLGANRQTINMVINGYKAIWLKSNCKAVQNATSGTGVSRTGTWSTGFDCIHNANGITNAGAFASTAGTTITYVFTDSTVIAFLEVPSVSSTNFTVSIDGTVVQTLNLSGKSDRSYGQYAIVITGLSNASHTLLLTNVSGGLMIADCFSSLIPASTALANFMWEVPKMSAAGYAGGTFSDAAANLFNGVLDSLATALPSGYSTYVVKTNNYYSTTTGVGFDNIHPSNTGHTQLNNGAIASLAASSPVTDGTIITRKNADGSIGGYFGQKNGVPGEFPFKSDIGFGTVVTNNPNTAGDIVITGDSVSTFNIDNYANVIVDSILSVNKAAKTATVKGAINTTGSSAGVFYGYRNGDTTNGFVVFAQSLKLSTFCTQRGSVFGWVDTAMHNVSYTDLTAIGPFDAQLHATRSIQGNFRGLPGHTPFKIWPGKLVATPEPMAWEIPMGGLDVLWTDTTGLRDTVAFRAWVRTNFAPIGGTGVTTVGSFSGSSQTNGATISSNTITFGPADGTNPGMMSTGTQTFAGTKTFNSGPIVPTQSLGTNNATVASTGYVDGSISAYASIKFNHSIFTPTTGGTVNLVNRQYNIINPAGTLLALTVNLPSSPSNNDVVFIKFTQNITTVTYANGTVVDGITAPTAGGLTVLTYDFTTNSWY